MADQSELCATHFLPLTMEVSGSSCRGGRGILKSVRVEHNDHKRIFSQMKQIQRYSGRTRYLKKKNDS